MKWFKHDADANADAKLQNVLLDYGLEGYGLYWYCIELIAGKVDVDNLTFQLEHDSRIIARNTGSSVKKVEEMMKYFIKIGLFESSEGIITCMKMAKRLDSSMTSNPKMRSLISQIRDKNHDAVMTKSCPNHDAVMQDKIRLDQNRIENTLSSRDDVNERIEGQTALKNSDGKGKKSKSSLPEFDRERLKQTWNAKAQACGLPKILSITKSTEDGIKRLWCSYLRHCKETKREPVDIDTALNGYITDYQPTAWAMGENQERKKYGISTALTQKKIDEILASERC